MAIKEKINSFFKVIRINKLWLSVFIIVLILCAGTILGFYIKTQIGQQREVTNNSDDGQVNNGGSVGNNTTITVDTSAIKLVNKQTGHCKALASRRSPYRFALIS